MQIRLLHIDPKNLVSKIFKSVFDLALCLKTGYSNCILILSDVGCFLFKILQNQHLEVLAARGVEDTKGRDWWEVSASNASTNGIAQTANSTSRNATSRPGEKGVTAAFGRLGNAPGSRAYVRRGRSTSTTRLDRNYSIYSTARSRHNTPDIRRN